MWNVRLLLVMTIALFVAIVFFILTGCTSSHPSVVVQPATIQSTTPNPVPVAVQQPPTAKDVATQVGCKRFHDKGNSPAVGVVDSGICWIGKQKYGVDTFMTKAARDSWLKMTESFGVNPKWETPISVVYKSILH